MLDEQVPELLERLYKYDIAKYGTCSSSMTWYTACGGLWSN